jgi:hypothetical protein
VLVLLRLLIPFLAISSVVSAFQSVSSGILRGAGKQVLGAVGNTFAYYSIGVPMSWFLCFKTYLKVRGLYIGITMGALFQSSIVVTLILRHKNYIFGLNSHNFHRLGSDVISSLHEDFEKTDCSESDGDDRIIPSKDDENVNYGKMDQYKRFSEGEKSDS